MNFCGLSCTEEPARGLYTWPLLTLLFSMKSAAGIKYHFYSFMCHDFNRELQANLSIQDFEEPWWGQQLCFGEFHEEPCKGRQKCRTDSCWAIPDRAPQRVTGSHWKILACVVFWERHQHLQEVWFAEEGTCLVFSALYKSSLCWSTELTAIVRGKSSQSH